MVSDISSCFNKGEQRDITANILLQDFDNTTFSEYDAVILPSGGHWGNLAGRPLVNEFLSDAYEAGLVVASICIAGKTLAQSGIIPEGTKVCTHSMANPDMNAAGAVITYERTVSHNRIITGGGGSGVPNGYENAPTYEVCREVIKAVRDLSGIQDITLDSTLEENRTYYQLSARLFNLTSILPEIEFENVSRIMAHIYEPDNEDPISSMELQDAEDNGTYSAAFYLSEPNEYTINMEIESDGNAVEVIQEAATAIIETPTSGIDMTVIAGVVCVLTVAGVVVLIVRRRP